MKTCFKCGESKPLDEFYRHPQMADGHLGKCKGCTKRDVNTRETVKREDPGWVASERARGRDKWKRLYRGKAVDPEIHKRANSKWYQANRHKKLAHSRVRQAVASGRLERPEMCQRCNRPGTTQAHHHDYTKPLDVEWLCAECHGKEHRIAS